jgi:hypothetical protein
LNAKLIESCDVGINASGAIKSDSFAKNILENLCVKKVQFKDSFNKELHDIL